VGQASTQGRRPQVEPERTVKRPRPREDVGCFATPAVASAYVAFAAEAKVVLVSEKGREDRASLSEMFLLDCHVDARQRDTHHHRDELPTKVEGCRATSKG